MRIIEINAVPYGSTGKIAKQVADCAIAHGHDARFVCAWSKKKKDNADENEWIAVGFLSKAVHLIMTRLTGLDGCFTIIDTLRLIKKIEAFNPDIIHLHIMHSSFLNNKILLKFIKEKNYRVVWTFHDCWNFTGSCPYFTMAKCDGWRHGCTDCHHYKKFASRALWNQKKRFFASLPKASVVTPSVWLADLTRQSMFSEYDVSVIHNGIDLSVFRPTQSNFRTEHKCEGKKIALGVAFGWGERKGLDVFIELAKRLPDDYQIVLVGTDENTDQSLPANIISIHRTTNQTQLAEIYTAADVLANPTREDNFPTVNLEALACGTPVITYKTGGSPECISERTGLVVESNTMEEMRKKIQIVCEQHPFSESDCIAHAQCFDMNDRFKEYIEMFEKLYAEDHR